MGSEMCIRDRFATIDSNIAATPPPIHFNDPSNDSILSVVFFTCFTSSSKEDSLLSTTANLSPLAVILLSRACSHVDVVGLVIAWLDI